MADGYLTRFCQVDGSATLESPGALELFYSVKGEIEYAKLSNASIQAGQSDIKFWPTPATPPAFQVQTFQAKPIKLESLPRFRDGLSLVMALRFLHRAIFQHEDRRQSRSELLDRDRWPDVRIQFNEYEFWNVFHRGAR